MKHNKKLIILVGNVGSGKSTIAKTYPSKGYIVISRDALRYGIGAGKYLFDPKLEQAICDSGIAMARNFMKAKVNMVIDEVNVCEAMRRGYLNLSVRYDYHTTALVFPRLTMKESVNRRMRDPHGSQDRKIWEGVWKNFDTLYECPTEIEGFDRVCLYNKCGP